MADNLPPNDNLESFFEESFKGFSEEPPDDLWDSIEANILPLPADKRFFLYRSWLLVAAMLLLVFGVSIFAYKVWQHEQKITDLSERVQDDSKKIEQLHKSLDSLQGVLNESKEEKNNSSNDALTFDKESDVLANAGENMADNTALHTAENVFFDENKKATADKNTENRTALKAKILALSENEKIVEKSFKTIDNKLKIDNSLNENMYSNRKTTANFKTKNAYLTDKTTANYFSDKESDTLFEKNIYEKNNSKNIDNQNVATKNDVEKNILKQNETDFYEIKKATTNNFANSENVFLKERENEMEKANHLGKWQAISPLSSLAIDEIEIVGHNKKLNFSDKKASFPDVIKPKKQRLAIGFYIAPTLPHRQLKNDNLPPPQNPPPNGEQALRDRLKAEEKAKISFRLGTNIAIPITQKIGLETGLQYEKICHTQRHIARIIYTESEATTDENGDITSAYKYNLDTSYGEVEVDFEVTNSPQNDGRDFAEGDIIPLHFKSRHEITVLSAPLLISYGILKKNNLSFDMRAGLVGKFLSKRDINVQEIVTERNRIRPKHEMQRREFQHLKRTSLDYQVGLAFNYGLNSNINLWVQPTFTRAFKALHTHKNIKTVPMQTSLNIGVSYNL